MSEEARKLFEIRREQWFRRCRRDFLCFCNEVLSRQDREPAAHHRLMIELLQAAADGTLLQLILVAPPGCGKITFVSYLYAAWYLAAHPGRADPGLRTHRMPRDRQLDRGAADRPGIRRRPGLRSRL